jgi:Zn-dependent protease
VVATCLRSREKEDLLMKWSWKVGHLAGIELRIHATFGLLITWVGASYWISGHGSVAIVAGVAFILAVFSCAVLHEIGHALAARRFGIPTKDITLLPIGGVARLEKCRRSQHKNCGLPWPDRL